MCVTGDIEILISRPPLCKEAVVLSFIFILRISVFLWLLLYLLIHVTDFKSMYSIINHTVMTSTLLFNVYIGYLFGLKSHQAMQKNSIQVGVEEENLLLSKTYGVFNLWFLRGLMMAH
jgi:hypothetical protein